MSEQRFTPREVVRMAIADWARKQRHRRGDQFATATELQSILMDPMAWFDLLGGYDAHDFATLALLVDERRTEFPTWDELHAGDRVRIIWDELPENDRLNTVIKSKIEFEDNVILALFDGCDFELTRRKGVAHDEEGWKCCWVGATGTDYLGKVARIARAQ